MWKKKKKPLCGCCDKILFNRAKNARYCLSCIKIAKKAWISMYIHKKKIEKRLGMKVTLTYSYRLIKTKNGNPRQYN